MNEGATSVDGAGDRAALTRRVVITGFMGAGKTTVARALAARLGCASIDADEFITAREGRSPREIIEREGEPRFREIESRVLAEILAVESARVVALGGGAWTITANRELIARRDCLTVWLDAPFELCWRRIARAEPNARPLAREREAARGLYETRRELYALASRRVAVDGSKPAEGVAAEIENLLRSSEDVRQGKN
ncbi:MAG: dephospho-CoA kinase [Acidobacteria bacterium]|nr:dephospho-CoA kinase [Acidobacteriota bacterium]MCA1643386.1 dephospho-CoA kinase [Acidobacteriota bacterium]